MKHWSPGLHRYWSSTCQRVAQEARERNVPGAYWSVARGDLNLNLVRFEVDVLGVVIAGEGTLEVGGTAATIRAGDLFYLPKGARRVSTAVGGDLAYLTCHSRRPGLLPTRARR